MNVEDRFAATGFCAFQFLCRSVGTQADVARVMEVGAGTVSRWWATEAPRDSLGRRPARSWRASWFGYPSPLPAYDRICERVFGQCYLDLLSASAPMEEVLERLRREGLSLGFLSREDLVSTCRALDIPDSSRLRWTETSWPSQWTALDRLSLFVRKVGWPEFVFSFEEESPHRTVELPPPALEALIQPLVRQLQLHADGGAGD